MRHTVAIVQRRLTEYRVPLFERMRELLAGEGVGLRVLYGDATPSEASKNDDGTLHWGEHIPTAYFAGGRICWQPFMHLVRSCDLVVVTQENKLVNNLRPMLSPRRRQMLALWGHGRNMQASHHGALAEQFKRWTTRRADWWFAYTEISAGFVREAGFDPARITVLDNAIDTSALIRDLAGVEERSLSEWRRQLGLGNGPIALFIGSLYADKRLDFLVEAADTLRLRYPNLHLLVIGDGPLRSWMDAAAASRPWLHVLGVQRGTAKAQLLMLANVVLNPGLVGLGILDSFAAGLPMFTTDCGIHSPEIAYLSSGNNGVMTGNSVSAYCDEVERLLRAPDQLARISAQAKTAAGIYTIAHMAERFANGALCCMEVRGLE